MKKHVSSGAVVFRQTPEKQLEYLVLFRYKEGTCHLPKGTKETGESLKTTAYRETIEESGVVIAVGAYLGSLPSAFDRDGETIQKETHYFVARSLIEGKSIDEEHDEARFLSYNEAFRCLKEGTWMEEEWIMLKEANKQLKSLESVPA